MGSLERIEPRPWMRYWLGAAAVYNVGWGIAVVAAPQALFQWARMEPPRYPEIWQCVGMIVGVYGIGYALAARHPYRHWPLVLVGLLGKVLGPLGFLFAALNGRLPWAWGVTIISNDLIWWVPFALILYHAARYHSAPSEALADPVPLNDVLATFRSHRGATLDELSHESPLLVLFIRHSGCTFCRESLADLASQRGELEARGLRLAIVHMSNPLKATQLASQFGLDDVHRFSDRDCRLYRAFDLERGSALQLFGPKVWRRAVGALLWKNLGLGMVDGDGFRMHGAFLLDRGRIRGELRANSAADRLDYQRLVNSVAEVELLASHPTS